MVTPTDRDHTAVYYVYYPLNSHKIISISCIWDVMSPNLCCGFHYDTFISYILLLYLVSITSSDYLHDQTNDRGGRAVEMWNSLKMTTGRHSVVI